MSTLRTVTILAATVSVALLATQAQSDDRGGFRPGKERC
jgi:hypothetical protein